MDNKPLSEGHILIIPKKHFENLYEISSEEFEHLFKIAKKVAFAVKKGLKADGITLVQNNDRAAGQDVFHIHVHIIPRYLGQKLIRGEERTLQENKENLDEIAEKIKRFL